MQFENLRNRDSESGFALSLILPVGILLLALTLGMLSVSEAGKREQETSRESLQRLLLAETGVARALADISGGGTGTLGSESSPVELRYGSFFTVAVASSGDGFLVTSVGTVGAHSRTLRARIEPVPAGVFHNAIFAGNSSGDPTYALSLGGSAPRGDLIDGSIYSGMDISVSDDAGVTGTIRAVGSVSGAEGESGAEKQPVPDLASEHYETQHGVDVAAEFLAHSAYAASAAGGSAWQLGEEFAAHIFRLNPSDRQSEFLGTEKDDYFLEDPYEPVSTSSQLTAGAASPVTLSGGGSEPGPDGNNLVYYIDGNLWVHNRKTFSFRIDAGAGEPVRVVFVVKGNIYFSDNVLRRDAEADGVAFIALQDSEVGDSGNIYFGDPAFGTLEQMDGYMYAENDFLDQNLNVSGSESVTINGIMSAGNQVRILRSTGTSRTQLIVNFDDRVKSGELDLPGLPTTDPHSAGYRVASVTESFGEGE